MPDFDGTHKQPEPPLTNQEKNILLKMVEFIRIEYPWLIIDCKIIERGVIVTLPIPKKATLTSPGTGW